jgi:PBSX family phage terminase large subunit
MSYVIDLTKNDKQKEYFNQVFMSIKSGRYKYFAYGGAIRGGKTFVTLFILILLCRKYKGSRWVVVREDGPALTKTTIPSIEKLLANSKEWEWHRDKSNTHVKNTVTGSAIYFYPENIKQDPNLNTFLGLECNGFFLEQAEELSEDMWSMSIQRAGSWYIDPMPPPFIFTTFNPTQKWVKKMFYEPYADGTLEPPYYFLEALPNDNPFVTKDQWDAWSTLDPLSYDRMIKGDWSAFAIDRPFAYCFDQKKHVSTVTYEQSAYLHLSFDFNVDPVTAIASQYINDEIRILSEFRLQNSNIHELCDRILTTYPTAVYMVTGDASGRARSALTQGTINYYTVIKQKLKLNDAQMKVPSVNPAISDSQVLCNSILSHRTVKINPSCTYLIDDLKYVEVNDTGDIDKTKDKHRSHLLDCWRYLLNTFHKGMIKLQ